MRRLPPEARRAAGRNPRLGVPADDELGHAVRPVLVEVPSVVGVPRGAFLEPVVGPQVDDDGVRVELRGKRPRRPRAAAPG